MSRTSCIGNMRHTTPTIMAVCIALLACGIFPKAASAQITAAQDLYSQAIAMPAAADAESRAEQMYLALQMAQRCPGRSKEERELTAKIRKSLAAIDPLALGLLKIQKRAATQVLKSARQLASAGMSVGAESLLALSLSLDPSVDCKAIKEIHAMQPAANTALLGIFADASLPYQGDAWVINEAGITSPPPQSRGQNVTSMLQSSRTLIGSYTISIEAQASTPSANFGIALGIEGAGKNYHLLSLNLDGDDSRISLDEFTEKQFENLAVQPLQLDESALQSWLKIEISVEKGRISASINGSAPLVVETNAILDGALGFFLAAGNANSRATSFRHLIIQNPR